MNISFTICSFIFTFILVIIFFGKKRIDHAETKMFSKILICTLLGPIIEFTNYVLKYMSHNKIPFTMRSYIKCLVMRIISKATNGN